MRKNNMPSVTVVVPCYNEEPNIANILSGVCRQKESGFRIEKILVISDGSTDGTVSNAKSIKDKRIVIMDNSVRKGKSYILNSLAKLVTTDILVLFDADVELIGNDVIHKLVQPILDNPRVGLVSGDFRPVAVRGFLQQSIESTIVVFETLRHEWKHGHNAFGCTGRIQAQSRAFYSVFQIDETMVLNDIYTYFYCVSHGFLFRHVRDVHVYYQLPTNLKDYLLQYKRFVVGSARMSKIFGDIYSKEYAIPKRWFYSLMFREFLKHPIHCLYICAVNRAGGLLAQREMASMNGMWEEVKSTKALRK